MSRSFHIEAMAPGDWPAVRAIYTDGLATGQASFETGPPSWEDWDGAHHAACRLVLRSDGEVLGWAALGPVSTRRAYTGVAEVSLYIAGAVRGRGLGRALLERLIAESEAHGFWTLQASIFPENETSLSIHRSCGFRQVGVREKIGRQNGRWRDTVLLERRSGRIGTQ